MYNMHESVMFMHKYVLLHFCVHPRVYVHIRLSFCICTQVTFIYWHARRVHPLAKVDIHEYIYMYKRIYNERKIEREERERKSER